MMSEVGVYIFRISFIIIIIAATFSLRGEEKQFTRNVEFKLEQIHLSPIESVRWCSYQEARCSLPPGLTGSNHAIDLD